MNYHRFLIAAFAFTVTLTISLPSHAHEMIEPEWCAGPNDEYVIIDTFEYDKNGLRSYVNSTMSQRSDGNAVDLDGKHGIVENWEPVRITITNHCDLVSPEGYTARPFITGPESYTSETHHKSYKIDHGLTGGCAVCIPRKNPISLPPCPGELCIEPDPPYCGGDCLPPLPSEEVN